MFEPISLICFPIYMEPFITVDSVNCISFKVLEQPRKENMLALKSVKDILRFMGLLMETDDKYSLHYVKNVVISLPMLVLLLPMCGYLVSSANHLLSATDVFYVIAADCLCIGQYWFLVAQKRQLLDLMSELQVLIDQSKWQFERFRAIDGDQFEPSISF